MDKLIIAGTIVAVLIVAVLVWKYGGFGKTEPFSPTNIANVKLTTDTYTQLIKQINKEFS